MLSGLNTKFENNVMDNCSLKVNVFTVTIFVFIIYSEKNLIVISLSKKLIYEMQNNLH